MLKRRMSQLWTGTTRLAGLVIGVSLGLCYPMMVTTAGAASLPGTATLSGTVDAAKPFEAAQVYIRNVDKQTLYMVYTSGGRYRAINLFPGNYELSVRAWGLESDVQKLALAAGQTAKANLSLREMTGDPNRRPNIDYLSFAEIYPPGPGLAVAQRTCMVCHGVNYLPARHWTEAQWNTAIDAMRGKGGTAGVMIPDKDMTPQDREALLEYLVKNFGPTSKMRAIRVDTPLPVDEKTLSKAMYIEYYLPKDSPGQGVNDPQYAQLNGPGASRRGQDPRFGPDGNVYLTDRSYPNRLVRLNPRTGEFKDFLLPDPKAGVHDLNIDKNGIAWLPENHGFPEGKVPIYLNTFNTRTEKWENRYQFDPDKLLSHEEEPHAQSLAIDSKGSVYVNMISGDALSKWDRETRKMFTFPLPTSPDSPYGGRPYGVVVDKNDNPWIAVSRRGKIAKFDAKTHKWTEYVPPTNPSFIRRLNIDDKGNIWFGIFSAGKLAKLDPAAGKITEWQIPSQLSEPYDTQVFAGEIWISDAGQEGAIVKFNPRDESFTFYPSPQARADKPKLQITREGAIWYSPRSSRDYPGLGVLYPDMDKMTTFAAMY